MWFEEGERQTVVLLWTLDKDWRRQKNGWAKQTAKESENILGNLTSKMQIYLFMTGESGLARRIVLQLGTKVSDAIICSFCFANHTPYDFTSRRIFYVTSL